MHPINYMAQMPQVDLGESIRSGFEVGNLFRQRRQEAEAQQAAQVRAQEYRTDLEGYFSDPTAGKAAQLMVKHPEQSKAFEGSWNTLQSEQKDAQYLATAQLYNALDTEDVDAARALIDEQILAAENSRQPTAQLKQIRDAIDRHPKAAKAYVGFVAAATDIDRWNKVMDARIKAEDRPLARAKLLADLEKTAAETLRAQAGAASDEASILNDSRKIALEAQRLNLDAKKLATETALKREELGQKAELASRPNDAARKIINDAAISSASAMAGAQEARTLLDALNGMKLSGGLPATTAEYLARQLGTQDEVTRFRQRFNALVSKQVIAGLPPGVATDKDVELVSRGFPTDTSSPEILESFLIGVEKIQKFQAAAEEAKADWVASFGDLSRAKKPTDVAGIAVTPGMTYTDFAKKYAAERYDVDMAPVPVSNPGGKSVGTPSISTRAAYDALPNGALYVAPDGKVHKKGTPP
jgi:hypothetical protein